MCMDLTKYTHATVVLTKDDTTLVIDPGAYTPNSATWSPAPPRSSSPTTTRTTSTPTC